MSDVVAAEPNRADIWEALDRLTTVLNRQHDELTNHMLQMAAEESRQCCTPEESVCECGDDNNNTHTDVQMDGLVDRIRAIATSTKSPPEEKTAEQWLENTTIYKPNSDDLYHDSNILLQDARYVDSTRIPWKIIPGTLRGYYAAWIEMQEIIDSHKKAMAEFRTQFNRAADFLSRYHAFPPDFNLTNTQIRETQLKAELKESKRRNKMVEDVIWEIIQKMEKDEIDILKERAEIRNEIYNN
jgi:hypothetical protein